MNDARLVLRDVVCEATVLPEGVVGIDAGLTLTKIAYPTPLGIELSACETASLIDGSARVQDLLATSRRVGITGARGDRFRDGDGIARVQEIEAAAHGAIALMRESPSEFVLALLGTGTAFAAVRGESVAHLGGTAMGGGSFSAIALRIEPSLTYPDMIERAARGNRRNADLMVSDAYQDGIGRIGAEMTAAHLAKAGGSLDDVLAALLNMHGENIAQIAAGRAVVAGIRAIVLAGGFAHENDGLTASVTAMARLFGLAIEVVPHAGFAGAIGAALAAGSTSGSSGT